MTAIRIALAAAFGLAAPAFAQDAISAADPAKAEDIVVTATRRVSPLADVPIAVTAVSARQLADTGATDIRQLNQLTPSLLVSSSSSENPVAKAKDSEPWKTGSNARYQYHPGGDVTKARKDAPSALNEVIIPNVNLPRVSLHPA